MYSKQRKDAAMWEKSAKGADKKLREVCSALWKEATDHEKLSAHRYTSGSSYINEPLRNIEYLGKYKGVYDSKKDTDALTSLVSRSRYKFDIWVQRGDGMIALKKFGLDMNNITPEAIKTLVGKEGIEPAFWSCGSFKGGGFASSEIIFNIYCPRGTQGLYMEPFSYFGHGVNGGKGMNCNNGLKWDGITTQKEFKCIPKHGSREVCLHAYLLGTILGLRYRYGRAGYLYTDSHLSHYVGSEQYIG